MSNNHILQFFTFSHLAGPLQDVSKKFHALAQEIDVALPDNPEKTVALRKLLEAKDCAVRALIFKAPERGGIVDERV